jgi:F-type H+-transporting ATPase subunit b
VKFAGSNFIWQKQYKKYQMNINWFTVIAQAINFIILVWLLKRFLYKPILNAIAEREKKITAQIKDADDKKAVAAKEQADFKKRNDDFDAQKKTLTDKAVADANAQRDKLVEGAKNDANTLRDKLEKALKEKQEAEALASADKTQQHVFAITKKVLKEMASSSLEEQSVNTFIKRLHALNEDEKEKFITAFKSNANTILVRSAFDLSAPQQAAMTDAVNETLNTKTTLQFTTTADLISGIELSTNGYKLAWSFAEYLNGLQKNIDLATKDEQNAKPELNTKPVTA